MDGGNVSGSIPTDRVRRYDLARSEDGRSVLFLWEGIPLLSLTYQEAWELGMTSRRLSLEVEHLVEFSRYWPKSTEVEESRVWESGLLSG